MTSRSIPVLLALLASAAAQASPLPDLTISDITVNSQCQPVITIGNLGPGELPASAMYTGSTAHLQLYMDGDGVGAWGMGKPELKPAGGSFTFIVTSTNHLVSGQSVVRATIDENSMVTEANETNNKLSRTLSCTPALPDLTIDQLTFDNECRVQVTIRNIGNAGVSSSHYGNVTVSRTIDGAGKGFIRLSDMDGQGQVAAQGGSVTWTDWPEFRPANDARYKLSVPAGGDANTANNERSITLPDRCKAGGSATTAPLIKPGIKLKMPARVIPRQ